MKGFGLSAGIFGAMGLLVLTMLKPASLSKCNRQITEWSSDPRGPRRHLHRCTPRCGSPRFSHVRMGDSRGSGAPIGIHRTGVHPPVCTQVVPEHWNFRHAHVEEVGVKSVSGQRECSASSAGFPKQGKSETCSGASFSRKVGKKWWDHMPKMPKECDNTNGICDVNHQFLSRARRGTWQ